MHQARRPFRTLLVAAVLIALPLLSLSAGAAPAAGLEAKLLASDGDDWDSFGWSVAMDGDTVLAGSPFDAVADYDSGSAYVFRRAGSAWTEEAKLAPSDGTYEGIFGLSVALRGDIAVVGAPGDDDAGGFSGSAYVFRRAGSVWTEEAKLVAADAAEDDNFGFSVAISGDAILVGSPFDASGDLDTGSAYVFRHSGSAWVQEAKLVPSDGVDWGEFGVSVALEGDVAVVGAQGDDPLGYSSGSAYVFRSTGSAWVQEAKLLPAGGGAYDYFGWSVAISGDTILVGSEGDDDLGSASGSAFVYRGSGSTWSEEAKLLAPDGAAGDRFGIAVAVDGDLAMIGAYGDSDQGAFSGSAHTFQRSGTTWAHQAKLVPSDGAAYDYFGWAVAVSGDSAVVGSDGDDDLGSAGGSARVYAPDADLDGVSDSTDNCVAEPNPNQSDFDGDAAGDACDPDDDNDGVLDEEDDLPFDPTESVDSDGDGIGNNADPDDDNDGILDGYHGTIYPDPAGDVTVGPVAAGAGGALALPGSPVCENRRVDITRFITSANDHNVMFDLTFAGAAGPSCLGASPPLLSGSRTAQVTLGWWGASGFLRIVDSSVRGTGCLAFGEYQAVTGTEQFEARCVRNETPTSVTYTLEALARVTSAVAPPVDLRTVDFGSGSASAAETATDSTRALGLRFHDSVARPAGRLP